MTHNDTTPRRTDELAATSPPEPATRLQETIAAARSARRRRRTVFIASAVALALVAGTVGTVAWAKANTAHKLEVLQTQVQNANRENNSAAKRLHSLLVVAWKTHASSEGKVVDDEVRVALAEAITTARHAPSAAAEQFFQLASGDSFYDAGSALDSASYVASEVESATDDLSAAVTTVREAQEAWELGQAVASLDSIAAELTASIEAATATFAGAEGKDLDQAALQALSDEINAATSARDATVDRTRLESVQAASKAMSDRKAALDAAAQTITEQATAWQTEQDRIATEQAAAAGQRSSGSGQNQKSSAGIGSTGSGNTGSKAAPAPRSSTPAPKSSGTTPRPSTPAAPPANNSGGGGGGWVEDFESYDWCGDTKGNSWQC